MAAGEIVVTVPVEEELLRQFTELDDREHVMEDYFRHLAVALAGKTVTTAYVVNMLSIQNINAINRSDELDEVITAGNYEVLLNILIPSKDGFNDAYAYWTRPVDLSARPTSTSEI